MTDNCIRLINKNDYKSWDELVHCSSQGTVFHTTDWIITASKLLNKKLLIIGEFKGEMLIGGCILNINDRYLYKDATSNLPLSPFGGFLMRDIDTKSVRRKEQRAFSTIDSITQKLASLNLDRIIITNSYGLKDIRPFLSNGWSSEVKYAYILPLTDDIEINLSSGAQKEIKKSQKANILIKKEYNIDLLWDLTLKMYKRQNIYPPFDKIYLEGLMDVIIEKKIGDMWVAETPSAETASALVNITDEKMAHGMMMANNPNQRDLGATTALICESSRDIYERGFRNLNLMAGNMDRLSAFYSSLNPNLLPYFSVKKFSLKGNIMRTLEKYLLGLALRLK